MCAIVVLSFTSHGSVVSILNETRLNWKVIRNVINVVNNSAVYNFANNITVTTVINARPVSKSVVYIRIILCSISMFPD